MTAPRLDLRESQHPKCGGKGCQERNNVDGDGLCTHTVSTLDNLPVRCVGEWAYDKIYRLVQYFGTFAGGMSKKWVGLNYVEICSGPGRCITREGRKEIDGTAMAIIRHKQFPKLKKGIFIDASKRVVDTLNRRINDLGASHIAEATVGDYADAPGLCRILNRLPDSCLNLVFMDPTECDVPFSTIQRIVAHLQNADLLINVAIGTDVNRNIASAATDPSFARARKKYESFLGLPGFCSRPDILALAKLADHDDLKRKFADAYKDQLHKLGYVHTDIRAVRHYYYLLFTSRDPRGLDFWKKSCKYAPDNQKEMF
jgi:three-Cys-motif partner protein